MTETIGNEELEMELLASKLLSGILLPNDYINLRSFISKLPVIDASSELDTQLLQLQKKVVSSFGTLKDSEVDRFYKGKNEELIELFKEIQNEVNKLVPLYGQATKEKLAQTEQELETNMQGQDFTGMADAINALEYKQDEIKNIDSTHLELRKFQGLINAIIPIYGTNENRLPSKPVSTHLDAKYRIFLVNLQNNLDKVTSNILLSSVMGRLFNSLSIIIPKDNLDPYKESVAQNLIDVLTSPENYYKDCETDRIEGDAVPTMFAQCYQQFHDKFLAMYLDKYKDMDYQEQINFRKCFALPEDNSELLALCNNYIKMSYT